MFGGVAFAEVPFATNADFINIQETLSVNPASPYSLTEGAVIAPITLTADDLDGGSTTLRLVAGSLPPGLVLSQALPYTAAVPFNVTITGTPTTSGVYSVTYENDDGISVTDQETLNFTVSSPSSGFSSIAFTPTPMSAFQGLARKGGFRFRKF